MYNLNIVCAAQKTIECCVVSSSQSSLSSKCFVSKEFFFHLACNWRMFKRKVAAYIDSNENFNRLEMAIATNTDSNYKLGIKRIGIKSFFLNFLVRASFVAAATTTTTTTITNAIAIIAADLKSLRSKCEWTRQNEVVQGARKTIEQ